MTSPAEIAIRLRRAAFNQALATGDLDAIRAVLAPDVVLVAGTDSAVLAGRKAQLLAWKREFAAPASARQVYLRTPGTITVSPVEPIAHEEGRWQGRLAGSAADAAPLAAGIYAAKWREAASGWVIEAEIFTTLA